MIELPIRARTFSQKMIVYHCIESSLKITHTPNSFAGTTSHGLLPSDSNEKSGKLKLGCAISIPVGSMVRSGLSLTRTRPKSGARHRRTLRL